MKKIICLLLVYACVFNFITLPAIAANGNTSDASEAVSLLSDLGVISGGDEAELITRGEFAVALYKLLNVNTIALGYDFPYTDVTQGDGYYEAVYSLYVYNVLSAAQTFRPFDNITISEASKMAVCALGYEFLAQSLGGYPAGYIAAAARLDIQAESSNSYVTKGGAWQMLFDMLFCNLPETTYGDELTYIVGNGGTLLTELWHVGVVSGKLSDAQYFGANYANGVGEGYAAIDGVLLKKGNFDTDSLFGEDVDAYYDIDDNVIVSIYSHDAYSKNIERVYSYQELTFDGMVYSYYPDGEDEPEIKTLADDTLIVYNGRKIGYDKSRMNPDHGFVKFVSGSGGRLEAIIIKSYIQAVAGTVLAAEMLVSDKLTQGVSYAFDEEGIVFTDQNGKSADFSQITPNDVLWISENAEGMIEEVRICEDIIIGELDGFGSQGIVYVDGKDFALSDYAQKQIETSFKHGDIINVCLNPDGEVVYVVLNEDNTSGKKIGYFVRSALQEKGLSSEILVKILNEEGVVNTYNLAPAFTVNGVMFKGSHSQSYAKLPKEADYPSSMPMAIVTYVLNENDEVTAINYPDDIAKAFGGKNYGLFVTSQVHNDDDKYLEYTSGARMVTCKGADRIMINGATYRFQVPYPKDADLAEDEDYKVIALTGKYTQQKHIGYTDVEGDFTSKYLVSMYNLGSTTSSVPLTAKTYMVEGVSGVITEEGVEAECLKVLDSSGKAASFYAKNQGYFSNLKLSFGDLVKLDTDAKGRVNGVLIIYRNGEQLLSNYTDYGTSSYESTNNGAVLNGNSGLGTISSNYVLLGNVFEQKNQFAMILPSDTAPDKYTTQTLYGVDVKSKNLLEIDTKTETAVKATTDVLKDYQSFGTQCSKVVVFMNSWKVTEIFMYK